MKRDIITIDEQKCNGCGACIPGCPEGALQIIDGKARLVSDLFCDGLGACIGTCPEGAITIEQREAEPYDEYQVMIKRIIPKGKETILAHLKHLKEHGAETYLKEAVECLRDSDYPEAGEIIRSIEQPTAPIQGGCPGTLSRAFSPPRTAHAAPVSSALSHWPVQMHLMNPQAPHYRGSDFVLAADCTAFAMGPFHSHILSGKTLGIACPKLDQGPDIYKDKLISLIDKAEIDTLTVVVMEVPCCRGLVKLALDAAREAKRTIPVKMIQISIQGEKQFEHWVSTSADAV